MRDTVDTSAPPSSRDTTTGLLRRFLQVYWLRPENAYWMALRSKTLANYQNQAPALDVACGDGLFSFLHGGGILDPEFDVFHAAAVRKTPSPPRDDMFNCFDETYCPCVVKPAELRFQVGLDHKKALLHKASKLSFYDQLCEHDCNLPLPFDNDIFETVYCNAAYWIDNIEGFLAELRRVTRPAGRIILQVKLDTMAQYTLASYAAQLGSRFLDIIDRGRLACWHSLTDQATWERRFSAADLQIVDATPFITATHAQIWDVGLRPLAPMLIKLANAVDLKTRHEVKADWVDLFLELALPICDPEFDLSSASRDPAELQYVLSPR